MRGKVCVGSGLITGFRITPAYAGKSSPIEYNAIIPQDHPRLCGEKILTTRFLIILIGSPPPMRGKGITPSPIFCPAGITPAYAGKRLPAWCRPVRIRGSPPPMRGKGLTECLAGVACGITPAYAGKRSAGDCPMYRPWDHPRLCGEKRNAHTLFPYSLGSPPPMRGKGNSQTPEKFKERITPAYAGKSSFQTIDRYVFKDHPRLCGEKVLTDLFHLVDGGSPPPMRGKVAQVVCMILYD